MQKAMLIVNPSSGDEKSKDFEKKAASNLKEFFDEVQVYHTQGEGDATSFCKQACLERYDSVFAMGGDGTINEAINGLTAQPYIPKFGFFPLGTVNDWARALHLSMETLTNTPAGQWRCVIGHTDTFCLHRAGRQVRHDAGFYENSGATTTQPQHRRGCLWATTCRQDNDTPLQPQSER